MHVKEARARIGALAGGPDSGIGLAARMVIEELWRAECRRDAVAALCRGNEVVDAAHVMALLGIAPDELDDDLPMG